jgi:hypothetical protein
MIGSKAFLDCQNPAVQRPRPQHAGWSPSQFGEVAGLVATSMVLPKAFPLIVKARRYSGSGLDVPVGLCRSGQGC